MIKKILIRCRPFGSSSATFKTYGTIYVNQNITFLNYAKMPVAQDETKFSRARYVALIKPKIPLSIGGIKRGIPEGFSHSRSLGCENAE